MPDEKRVYTEQDRRKLASALMGEEIKAAGNFGISKIDWAAALRGMAYRMAEFNCVHLDQGFIIPYGLLEEFAELTRLEGQLTSVKSRYQKLENLFNNLQADYDLSNMRLERQASLIHDLRGQVHDLQMEHQQIENNERSSSPFQEPRIPDSNDSLPSYLDQAGQEDLWRKFFLSSEDEDEDE